MRRCRCKSLTRVASIMVRSFINERERSVAWTTTKPLSVVVQQTADIDLPVYHQTFSRGELAIEQGEKLQCHRDSSVDVASPRPRRTRKYLFKKSDPLDACPFLKTK